MELHKNSKSKIENDHLYNICHFFLVKLQFDDEVGLSCEGSENARKLNWKLHFLVENQIWRTSASGFFFLNTSRKEKNTVSNKLHLKTAPKLNITQGKINISLLICPFFSSNLQSEDELGLSCEGSENARQIELEQRILETRLRQQQLQSEEDSKWLLKEENNLKKRLSITASVGSDDLTGSTDNVEAACGGGTGSSAASTGLSGGSSSAASTGLSGGSSATGGGGSSRSAESSPRQHSLETKDKPVVVKVRTFFLLSPSSI